MGLIEDFLVYKETVSELSPGTLKEYRALLGRVEKIAPLNQFTKEDVLRFISEGTERGRKRSSIGNDLTVLNHFYAVMERPSPVSHILRGFKTKQNAQKSRPQKTLSPDEVKKILSLLREDSFPQLRNKLIIQMMRHTGCRVGELAQANLGDLNLEELKWLIPHSKNGRARVVSTKRFQQLLESYHYARSEMFPEMDRHSDPVFVSEQHRRLSTNMMLKIVNSLMERAGVKIPGRACHAFRHVRATELAAEFSPSVGAAYLGHSVQVFNRTYTHLEDQAVDLVQEKEGEKL